MKKTILLLNLFFLHFAVAAPGIIEKGQSSKENEVLDFKSIKKIIKNDQLESIVNNKINQNKKNTNRKKSADINRFNIPDERKIWTFLSELWLVKNAQLLKWDFQKPDFALAQSFRAFLEQRGHFEYKFKILVVNTPNVTHFALPSNRGELIFILSLPFIRTLDLSKLEISLLLYEDFQRNELEYFKKNVKTLPFAKMLGTNFYKKKKLETAILKKILTKYDQIIYDEGFDFKQQFAVTTRVDSLLKSDLRLWNTYFQLVKKIADLVKSNLLYSKYNKIYPSPELQLGWLTPKSKKI